MNKAYEQAQREFPLRLFFDSLAHPMVFKTIGCVFLRMYFLKRQNLTGMLLRIRSILGMGVVNAAFCVVGNFASVLSESRA